MIVHTSLRAIRAAGFAAVLLASPSAFAIEETTRTLAEGQQTVESMEALGADLKAVLRPDIGFPEENVAPWQAAVDAAFARELLEADFLAALEERLTDEGRDAALEFNESTLGEEVRVLVEESQGVELDDELRAETEAFLESVSDEHEALFTDLFDAQTSVRRSDLAMDLYFRAMKIAAEPVIGAEAADAWIDGAQDMRDIYTHNYFLTSVATYRPLSEEKLREFVEAIGSPGMFAFSEQSTAALGVALEAASDRLQDAYTEELDNR